MTAKLLPLINWDHSLYGEAFGGGMSMLFAKKPSENEIYNDLDQNLVRFFRLLQNKEKFDQFHWMCMTTPSSREYYNECVDTWRDETDEVIRYHKWYIVTRMSFGGLFGKSKGYALEKSMAKRFKNVVDRLPEIVERIRNVELECETWEKIFDRYDHPNAFWYLDPPYYPETRRAGGYTHELTCDDHVRLIETIQKLEGKVMLSGYANPTYIPLEDAGWHRFDWKVQCNAVGRTRFNNLKGKGAVNAAQPRIETAWLSYPPPQGIQETFF